MKLSMELEYWKAILEEIVPSVLRSAVGITHVLR